MRTDIELKQALDNYKRMHRALAESKSVIKAFLEAKTLTQARKVLFG